MTDTPLVERLPLTFTDTPDYAEVRDAQGTLIALTTDPVLFTRLQETLAAAEAERDAARKKALEEAAAEASSWEVTARKIAGNEDEHERRVLHEVAADMARDIANALRALSQVRK